MIKKYFPILILSVICLAACSKKENNEASDETSSPIMSVVNETPAEESQEPLRDPMQNIVTDANNNAADANNTAQPQNLAGDIPPGYVSVPTTPVQDPHFSNPMDRVVVNGQATAMSPDNSNVKVTRTPDGGSMATATAPTLKSQAASSALGDGRP